MERGTALGLAVVVLAAGEGKRMKSDLPKVLHRAAGRPLLAHVLSAVRPLEADQTVVVTSRRRDEVVTAMEADGFRDGITWAVQDPPRGTADAVRVGLQELDRRDGRVLVTGGDTPLLTTESLRALIDLQESTGAALCVLTASVADPTGYGRVIRDSDGRVQRIVEHRDATEEERLIHEINAGVYVFEGKGLSDALRRVDASNVQGEYYLTDAVEILVAEGAGVAAHRVDEAEVVGVNSRAQLAHTAAILRAKKAEALMAEGVTIVDPSTTYIDSTVSVGRDAVIHPFSFLEGATRVGRWAQVGPQARVVSSEVDDGATVSFAVVVESSIGPGASVGPFASLRAGTRLERGARVGSFVETKKSVIGEDSKANHLAYIGDAEIGRGVNVGAGTITCNWDGVDKHKTVIEDDAYIGSDTMLVAPAHIGKRAATGAGSVVKGNVPDDALAVGMPARILGGKGDKMGRKENDGPDDS
jgi:bifunctional UDP-N-acetylglucosamine pyrophosphorylase/glucosamine-1-phosphate N-acetyltransferase